MDISRERIPAKVCARRDSRTSVPEIPALYRRRQLLRLVFFLFFDDADHHRLLANRVERGDLLEGGAHVAFAGPMRHDNDGHGAIRYCVRLVLCDGTETDAAVAERAGDLGH